MVWEPLLRFADVLLAEIFVLWVSNHLFDFDQLFFLGQSDDETIFLQFRFQFRQGIIDFGHLNTL